MKQFPNIKGFNKCSEAGMDVFAPAIFLAGCNLCCPYCMNASLVKNLIENNVSIDKIKAYVLENKSEWFMISGGEPTCTESFLLINLLKEIKSWGCKTGMCSNGVRTESIRDILPHLNYVAMDIKSPKGEDYDKICTDKFLWTNILLSRSLLCDAKLTRNDFDYEIRTTLYPPFINRDALREIGGIIRKDDKWLLQQFRHSKSMLSSEAFEIEPYDKEEVAAMLNIAKEHSNHVALRYV